MTYDEAIRFWYGRINYEVRSASADDLKLERMRGLLRRLGDPHLRLRCVHVAGTKGKGSTCAMVESVARRAGYRTGLFTSPHLERVEERLQVGRVPIGPDELAALVSRVEPAVREMDAAGGEGPTFFEIITAVAFLHFLQRRVEMTILEVGLGGRFDSTNICRPIATAITSIGLDHTQQLGDTPELIAYQKAGIIKPRVPVAVGPIDPGPMAVIQAVADSLNAPVIETAGREVPPVGLPGSHQQANARVALTLLEELRRAGYSFSESVIGAGFATLNWPGRIELLHRNPTVILDSAHNLPSVNALLDTLPKLTPAPTCRENRHIIFAVASDKDYGLMLRRISAEFGSIHLTRFAANPRSVPVEELATIALDLPTNTAVYTHMSAKAAWAAAWAAVPQEGLVCVAGSAFLAGELRPVILSQILAPL